MILASVEDFVRQIVEGRVLAGLLGHWRLERLRYLRDWTRLWEGNSLLDPYLLWLLDLILQRLKR